MILQGCKVRFLAKGQVMSMPASSIEDHQSLTASQGAALRLAASKMTGPQRRAVQAEMALKYGEGHLLLAETIFGGGRHTVAVGLAERRTGIICLGAPSAFSGRKRWEDTYGQEAEALRQLAEAHAQQDPTLRRPLAYTRLTAKAARVALRAQGYGDDQLPAPSTMAEVLNCLGFRLRKVVKAKPQKKIAETDALVDNIEQKTQQRRPRRTSSA
jgi:Rhodopirellula transposase DDE domain